MTKRKNATVVSQTDAKLLLQHLRDFCFHSSVIQTTGGELELAEGVYVAVRPVDFEAAMELVNKVDGVRP
jgi:hypothetical protein